MKNWIIFFVIGDMSICKTSKIYGILSITNKKNAQPFEKKNHIFFIKFWTFYNGDRAFF